MEDAASGSISKSNGSAGEPNQLSNLNLGILNVKFILLHQPGTSAGLSLKVATEVREQV